MAALGIGIDPAKTTFAHHVAVSIITLAAYINANLQTFASWLLGRGFDFSVRPRETR